MMTVFVNQVIDEIESVPIKAVDKGKARPMPIAETHHTGCTERHDASRQQGEITRALRPHCVNNVQRAAEWPTRTGGGLDTGARRGVFPLASLRPTGMPVLSWDGDSELEGATTRHRH